MNTFIKEYGTVAPADWSVRTVLASAPGAFGSLYELTHKTEGYEPAGSCARYTKELYGCLFTGRHTNGGQWYKTQSEARAHFERVTTPIVEQRT